MGRTRSRLGLPDEAGEADCRLRSASFRCNLSPGMEQLSADFQRSASPHRLGGD